jgi:DNA polymerase-3 subunit gamma/tau
MSYLVIARKWRPQTFEEVTGQEAITRTLRNALEHDRLHHAYLFSGARGVGKTTTARLLAKALNCQKSDKPTLTPCSIKDADVCSSCREISEGRSMDVLEFDAASNTQVDKIRELIIENINIAPARDRFKIFIIDEVHMLSNSSFNALLKTLEEPPPRVVFVMATTELHKLPDTILSRCQQFEFRTIATNKIFERLKLIADAEKVNISNEALREIARAGEGSMRDAQSAFDQVISFSGEKIDTTDVISALGIAGSEMLNRVMHGIAEHQPAEALKVVDELVTRGHDLRNFCRDLLTHIRDLMVVKVAGDIEGLVDSTATTAEELHKQAAQFTESDLVRFFHSLADTEQKLKEANQPRYQLEIGLVKLMEMRRVTSIEKILERLANLEEALAKGNLPSGLTGNEKQNSSPAPVPPKTETPFKQTAPPNIAPPNPPFEVKQPPPEKFFLNETANKPTQVSAPPESAAVSTAAAAAKPLDLRVLLKQYMDENKLGFLSEAVKNTAEIKINSSEIVMRLAAGAKFWQDTWEKSENAKVVREFCVQKLGRELNLRVELNEKDAEQAKISAEDEQKQQETQALLKLVENDPAVQNLLKVFRGKIVRVRQMTEEEIAEHKQLEEKRNPPRLRI